MSNNEIYNNRALIILAASKLSSKEIADLHQVVRLVDYASFAAIIREAESKLAAVSIASREEALHDPVVNQLVGELSKIRTGDLKVTVPKFSDALRDVLLVLHGKTQVPRFEARRGFTNWIADLLRVLSPSELLQAGAILRERGMDDVQRPWQIDKLR